MAGYACVFQTGEEYEEYKTNKKFNAVNIEFITEPDIKRPKISDDGSFYIVCSPEKLKLISRDSTMLNLRLKLNVTEKIEAMVGLFPGFVSRKLSIEKSNWISNKKKDKSIQFDILNKHFYDTIKIKKSRTSIYLFNQPKKS